MKLRVEGKTALDDPLVCRCCGHHFTASDALMKMSIDTFDEVRRAPHASQLELIALACPKCKSDDIAPEAP